MRLQQTIPLSDFQRQRIISLWIEFQCNGKTTPTKIKRILALEGIITTHRTIRNNGTGLIRDRPRIGQIRIIPPSHYRFIDDAMSENDEYTAAELKKLLIGKFGEDKVPYSERTISRARNELGWTFTTSRYCQAIRDANKAKRVIWVNKCLEDEESFDNVIFTDECTVQLECHRGSASVRKMLPESLNININPCQKFMFGLGFRREELQIW